MIEHLFKQLTDGLRFALNQIRVTIICAQSVERGIEVSDVAKIAAEMIRAVNILRKHAAIAVRRQRGDEFGILDARRVKAILRQKTGQIAVRIEHVRMLIRPIHPAAPQCAQHVERLGRGKQPRRKRGDLTFQHFV